MIKRELMADPALKNENWDRFLPKFKRSKAPPKKKLKIKEKKPYTPFPPPQRESKVSQLSVKYFSFQILKFVKG